MRSFAFVALAALAAGGCQPDCLQSADIRVAVTPPVGVPASAIAQLQVTVMIGADGVPMSEESIKLNAPLAADAAFLLRPMKVPSSSYTMTVTIYAADSAGTPMALGTDTETVQANGCNHMMVHLGAIPGGGGGGGGGTSGGGGSGGGGTGGGGTDAGIPDMSPPPDLSGCQGSTPDEDSDGRGDACDVCAADPDPAPFDTDGDGLPDACDPDPTTPTNHALFFEPFNADSGHWSLSGSSISINGGVLEMQNNGQNQQGAAQQFSGDSPDILPTNVRVQTWFTTGGNNSFSSSSTVALLLGSDANLNQANTTGAWCSVNLNPQSSPTLEIDRLSNDTVIPPQNGVLTFKNFPNGMARIRLTQRGTAYTCELATLNSDNTVTIVGQVAMTVSTAPVGDQFVSLMSQNLHDTKFHSVVAETALP